MMAVCHSRFRCLVKPRISQAPNASCTYAANGSLVPPLSAIGIKNITAHCPMVISVEAPDSCGVNLRKQCCSTSDFSDNKNVLWCMGKCGCHQCHRVVVQAEKPAVGDVHGICVACANPSHAHALSGELRSLLREAVIRAGPPPDEFVARNKEIIKHTLLRRLEFVAPSCGDGDASHLDREKGRSAADEVLKLWNGNWALALVEHCCIGPTCCENAEHTRDN